MDDQEMLAILLTDVCFRATGFGPSLELSREYAGKIIEQAHTMNVSLVWKA